MAKRLIIQQTLDNDDVFATHSKFDALFGLAICSNAVKLKHNKSLLQIQDSCLAEYVIFKATVETVCQYKNSRQLLILFSLENL